MHQTTVRFSPELWSMLEREAAQSGVSVAHYVRDAALARIAFAAGQRSAETHPLDWADPRLAGAAAREESRGSIESATAVTAQAQLASARSVSLRSQAQASRDSRTRR